MCCPFSILLDYFLITNVHNMLTLILNFKFKGLKRAMDCFCHQRAKLFPKKHEKNVIPHVYEM
jgi:hypothetical protein